MIVGESTLVLNDQKCPDELFDQDPKYWNMIINIAHCNYDEECDVSKLNEILTLGVYRNEVSEIPPISSSWIDKILPKAFAWSETYHYSMLYGEPYSCTYGNCKVTETYSSSVGEHTITAEPPFTGGSEGQGHGTHNYMKMHASTCSNSDGYNYVILRGTIGGQLMFTEGDSGLGCTHVTEFFQASQSSNPYYIWYANAVTNSWMP